MYRAAHITVQRHARTQKAWFGLSWSKPCLCSAYLGCSWGIGADRVHPHHCNGDGYLLLLRWSDAPELIRATMTVPLDDTRSTASRSAVNIQTLATVAGNGLVVAGHGLETPLLVSATMAVPLDYRCSVVPRGTVYVQAFAAVHGHDPVVAAHWFQTLLLVGIPVAIPLDNWRSVAPRCAMHIETFAATSGREPIDPGTATRPTGYLDGRRPVVAESISAQVGVASGEC